jgi:hypothetical protein
MVARPIDQMRLHIGKASPVLDKRGTKVAGSKRGVYADCEPTALASRAGSEPRGDRVGFFDNTTRGFEKFLSLDSWPSATICAFEKNGA